MKRRTFDKLMSMAGLVITVMLIVGGVLAFVGYRYADDNVTSQLKAQKIFFPEAGSEGLQDPRIKPYVEKYAGQQLVTGEQARVYADHYIAVHLEDSADGRTYAETSTLSRQNPDNAELAGQVQTLFRGETLRGLLLNAYAFWKLGQIALIASIVAFAAAALMGILTILGFVHARKVSPEAEILAEQEPMRRAV